MADKLDMIYDTLVRHHEEASDRMTRIEDDLREHKEGVIQNRTRIEKLEEPGKALSMIKKWALWLASISAGAAGLSKIMGWL